MARPTKFTRDTIDKLVRATRMGATKQLACAHAGISYATLNDWENGKFPRNLDDDQKALKAEFFDILTRAVGDSGVRALSVIQQAAHQGDWRAAAWLLEHRFPEDYGKAKVELTGKDGGPVEIANVKRRIADLARQVAAEEGIVEYEGDLVTAVTEYLEHQREGDDA